MKKTTVFLGNLLNVLMAVSLAVMAVLVFGNVVLRYLFNSGITWSEEMARFLFVWMVFLGAIGALSDRNHLSVDMVVKRLSPKMKKAAYVITHVLMLYILWLVLDGSWKMTMMSLGTKAPATGLPQAFIYGIGIVMSVSMSFIILRNVYQTLFPRTVKVEEKVVTAPYQQAAQGGGSS
ncbi:TRAP transporter small permease [Ammoniphilus sp. YIM 78166]|uniref:TRAP transporter small permease n=1 Tax=Ammoniphilus sp. YIM 78166 TaxID=1644106 RepID=UPI003513921F